MCWSILKCLSHDTDFQRELRVATTDLMEEVDMENEDGTVPCNARVLDGELASLSLDERMIVFHPSSAQRRARQCT